MTSISPVQSEAIGSTIDIEKKPVDKDNVNEVLDDEKYDIEDGSVHKQDGVRRVEAITSVWSKQTLVLMFIL